MLYTGCEPSHIDGTEIILNIEDTVELPDTFTWEKLMPPVRDQGNTQTCVCQTLTGILDFYYNASKGISNKCNNFSIDELYSMRSNKGSEGMSIKEGMQILKKCGLNTIKIDNYAKINSSLMLQRSLFMFGPVAAGFPCYDNDSTEFWQERGRYCGGHCVMIVGYTPTGFIIRNSWGVTWGKNGYAEISYHEFNEKCFESWTTTL